MHGSSHNHADRRFHQDTKSPAFYNNPYRLYARFHEKGGPVFWQEYGMWCLCEFDAVDQALRDRRFARLPPAGYQRKSYPAHLADFAKSETHSLLALEPPEHTRLRQSVNRAFVSRKVAGMASQIQTLANDCIDRFANNNQVELLGEYATPIPVAVIAQLLGVPEHYCDDLLAWSHAMVRVYTMTQTREEDAAANAAAQSFRELLLQLIDERKRFPTDDLLSHLVALQSSDPQLLDEEIICTAILLLNAGHEATVHQLGNAVHMLLKHKHQSGWCNDDALTDAVVAESVRLDAPLHLFTRYAQQDMCIGHGVQLRKGEEIALLLGAANRDPNKFQRADEFIPSRTDGASVSFGAGIHFCIGIALARLELRIALQTLFKRLPDLQLSDTPQYQNKYHFHGLQSLNLQW